MAVRFPTGGNYLKMTAGLLPSSGFDVCFWARRRATNAFGTVWGIENATTSATKGIYMELDSVGTTLSLFDNTGAARITGPLMTVDVWYWFFLSVIGTNTATMWWAEERAKDLTSGAASTLDVTWTPALMSVCTDSFDPTDRADMEIAHLMMWIENHGQGFVNEQRFSYLPVDEKNLHSWFPMDIPIDAHLENSSYAVPPFSTKNQRWTLTGTPGAAPDPLAVLPPLDVRPAIIRTAAGTPPPPPTGQFWLAAAA